MVGKSSRILAMLTILTVFGSAARVAQAEAVTLDFDGVSPYKDVKVKYGSGYSKTTATFRAGQMNWTNTVTGDSIATFCIEITQFVYNGGVYTYDVVPMEDAPSPGAGAGSGSSHYGAMGDAKADLVRELWGRFYDTVADAITMNSSNAANYAAAFQLAIWEIVHDTGLSLSSGYFATNYSYYSTPYFVSLAQSWLNSLDGTGPMEMNLIGLSSLSAQDQLGLGPEETTPICETPEPGSMVLLGIGAGLMGIVTYRRRRLNAVAG